MVQKEGYVIFIFNVNFFFLTSGQCNLSFLLIKGDVQCMFDSYKEAIVVSKNLLISCISQNDFSRPQYVNFFLSMESKA